MPTAVDLRHRVAITDHPLASEVLTDDVLAFLVGLHERFGPCRSELLSRHQAATARHRDGERPTYDAETAYIRSNEWHIAPAPRDLVDRRTELVGLVSRPALVEGLNSGAQVYMADFEDTITPEWATILDGQRNLAHAYAGTLTAEIGGEIRIPNPDHATLMVRTRGWHLDEANLAIDGQPIAASLFDFGVCVAANAAAAAAAGTGPYFYLPKFEGPADAQLWHDVLEWTEAELGLAAGTIRVSVLIETVGAAFAMDEILFALRDHITALHAGNWDYLFSMIKTFAADPEMVLPDRDSLGATTPFIRAFTELLVSTCHRRGAHAIGGMSGVIPDELDPARTAPMVRKVTVDKRREAGDGFDGTRIGQPAIVDIATAEFDRVLSYRANQLEVQRDDVYITASDLLTIHTSRGECTESGLRTAIRTAVHYIGEWLVGVGAVAIDDHLEDTAMAELCRAQIWQWRHQSVRLTNDVVVDNTLLDRLFAEELAELRVHLGEPAWADGRYERAAELLRAWSSLDDLIPFFPIAVAGDA
ncbi:MAG: malate synthase A [Actinomycetota bacterium]|nr:malate synthase A [Actinomycetota bacterium]